MIATATRPWMTTEELLTLPDDEIDRDLIRGELQEEPMTKRNRWHSGVEAKLSWLLRTRLLASMNAGRFRYRLGSSDFSDERDFQLRRLADLGVRVTVDALPAAA